MLSDFELYPRWVPLCYHQHFYYYHYYYDNHHCNMMLSHAL